MTQTSVYDFDSRLDHRAHNGAKWFEYDEDVLPLWVADMDFKVAPAIIEALHERVDFGVFAYTRQDDVLLDLICQRMKRLYDWDVQPEEIILIPGVVAGLMIAADFVGKPGDGILNQTPIYGPFLTVPPPRGRFTQMAELNYVADDDYTFYYEFDPAVFEAEISKQTSMLYFCNPHNPTGQMYSREEIEQIAEICARHDMIICSDEIHCDLLLSEKRHIPTASISPEISQRTITLMAPSKTFNLPGLQGSFAIIQNAELREKFTHTAHNMHAYGWGGANLNILTYTAMRAAYEHAEDWKEAMLDYVRDNRDFARAYLRQHIPQIKSTNPEATFLIWLDCRGLGLTDQTAKDFFVEKARVAMNPGSFFGNDYDQFVRLNLACPRSVLEEALERMAKAVQAL